MLYASYIPKHITSLFLDILNTQKLAGLDSHKFQVSMQSVIIFACIDVYTSVQYILQNRVKICSMDSLDSTISHMERVTYHTGRLFIVARLAIVNIVDLYTIHLPMTTNGHEIESNFIRCFQLP